jgi:hypothetical protein
MNRSGSAFEPKNLFRNAYFWLAAGGAIFLFYVGFIAFTFLPRSTSEVTANNSNDTTVVQAANKTPETEKRSAVSKNRGDTVRWQSSVVTNGGWVDSDDRKMTIVMRVSGLDQARVEEIIRSGGIEIEIDGVTAEIINSEPYRRDGFLTRAKAALAEDKFENFSKGKTARVEIATTLRYGGEMGTKIVSKSFAKKNKTDVEGVEIAWK